MYIVSFLESQSVYCFCWAGATTINANVAAIATARLKVRAYSRHQHSQHHQRRQQPPTSPINLRRTRVPLAPANDVDGTQFWQTSDERVLCAGPCELPPPPPGPSAAPAMNFMIDPITFSPAKLAGEAVKLRTNKMSFNCARGQPSTLFASPFCKSFSSVSSKCPRSIATAAVGS